MGSLDFFKSCSTNVRVVENLLEIQYSLRRPLSPSFDRRALSVVIRALRERNILCTAGGNEELWIFGAEVGTLEDDGVLVEQICEFNVEDSGLVSADPKRRIGDGRLLKVVLLEAIEASISFNLSKEQGMLHIGLWTWLFAPLQADTRNNAGTLLRLHTNLTESGALYISTTTQECSLKPLSGVDHPQRVQIAPSGKLAIILVNSTSEHGGATRRSHMVGQSATWKSNVIEVLSTEGIDIRQNEGWTAIQLTQDGKDTTILWPTRLCLGRQSATTTEYVPQWKKWLATASSGIADEMYKDPIAEAEEWFHQASSTNTANAEPSSEVIAAPISSSMVVESPLATSPPFNQRLVDQQAAMSGIYPTPPDGLLPAHMLGPQTSTSEAPLDTMQQSDQAPRLLESDDTQLENGSRTGFSAEPQTYNEDGLTVDDLFGDVGALDDELGGNEVGDADFDYFDDGPDEAVDTTKDVEMVDGTSPAETVAPNVEEVDAVQDSVVEQVSPIPDEEPVEPPPEPLQLATYASDEPITEADAEQKRIAEEDQPLSPFRIRERLLPPPIPASAAQQQPQMNHLRRKSTFDAMDFNKDLDLSVRYTRYSHLHGDHSALASDRAGPNIGLPQKRKRDRMRKPSFSESGVHDGDIAQSSEDDSLEDASSTDEDMSPTVRLPWDMKKRKRDSVTIDGIQPAAVDEWHADGVAATESSETIESLLGLLITPSGVEYNNSLSEASKTYDDLESIESMHEFSQLDLVYIAQVVSEQAVTVTKQLAADVRNLADPDNDHNAGIRATFGTSTMRTIHGVLPSTHECDISKLALVKEAPPRTPSLPSKMGNQSQPGLSHPRQPASREGGLHNLGLDYFAVAPPFVHVQRSSEAWELLPPALSFWSELGLGPANGAKDVTLLAVIPETGSEDLRGTVTEFLVELKRGYEGRKMGSLEFATRSKDDVDEEMEDGDGVNVLQALNGTETSLSDLFRGYAKECAHLGSRLAQTGHLDPKRTIVVCMVNMFGDRPGVQQRLCACFLLLCRAYKENAPKAFRNAPRSDIDLQILPVSLIASFHGPVILDSHQIEALAAEIYDRCPPSANAPFDPSPISSILAAPAVQLASPPPKRIGFQLSPDPPSDLLHEGSILHLAYAFSPDGEWMTVCWADSTGRYRRIFSACLRGKPFLDVAGDVWTETADILSAREVMWRVFIVSCGTAKMDGGTQNVWKEIVSRKARKQMLHVTLLSMDTDPALQLSPSATDTNAKVAFSETTPGGGFLTPVSTPQAATFTVSPDASAQNNAPLTPAPSDTVASIVENDPDAHLVDTTDETWGMLLAPSFTASSASSPGAASPQASGVLFQRGSVTSAHLTALGVDLYWDIRVRPNGVVDEGPQRQAEATLREVLKMYRNLSVLTKAKMPKAGRDDAERVEFVPVHASNAMRAAEGLDWYLRGVP